MRRHSLPEGEFAVPETWLDASTTTLIYDHPDGPVKLLVMRLLTRGETLAEAHQRQLDDLRRQLPRFELVAAAPRTVAGQQTTDTAIRFAHEDGPLYQRMASLLFDGRLVVLAAQGPPEQSAAVDALFEQAASNAAPRSPSEEPWP